MPHEWRQRTKKFSVMCDVEASGLTSTLKDLMAFREETEKFSFKRK